MNGKTARLLATSIAIATTGCSQNQAESPASPFAAIDGYVAQSMEESGTPGLTLAVTTRDALQHVGTYGYADLKLREPVTEETLFQIGSISKSFTALGLLMLHDRGVLDLEKPLVDYLPWFDISSAFPPISTHHLLSHTAGIPGDRDDIAGSRYMAWALRQQETAWAPGERFLYSNVGYQTLHVLLEDISGIDYATYVKRGILDPLDMRHTNPAILLESRAAQAVGYIQPYDDRPAHRSRPLVEAPFFEYGMGDGSIQSTAADMASYARLLLNRGQGPQGRLVSEEAFELFSTPHIEQAQVSGTSGYGYGMGVRPEDDHRYLAHSGGMIGFSAYLLVDMTDGLGVVVMVNGPSGMVGIASYAMRVMQAVVEGSELPPIPEKGDPAPPENVPEYVGSFTTRSGDSLGFVESDDGLRLNHTDGAITLEPRGEDVFYTPHPDFDRYAFWFGRDDDGSVVEVLHGSRWFVSERYQGPTEYDSPIQWESYPGRYRSHSPWFSYFEVALIKGNLVVISDGGEGIQLVPREAGVFQVGTELTPDLLRFQDVVDGQALRAEWSGHQFHRVGW